MIPYEAIEAAAKAFIEHGTLLPALEAAAPHMLRVVSTVEQLDALPIGSVILGFDDDLDQLVSRKSVDEAWEQAGTDDGWQAAGIIQWYGSVTVLYEGNPYRSQT